jgi:hypothetical protein
MRDRMTNVFTRDLTEKLSKGQRDAVAAVVAVALSAPVFILPINPWALLTAPVAFIGLAVALRISGPKDAKSFRLYRRAALDNR